MKKPISMLIIAAALTGLTLSAVAPAFLGQFAAPVSNVYSVGPEYTILGVQRALSSAPGTLILQKNNLTMFMWTLEHGWCFLVLDNTKAEVIRNFHTITGGGNYVNAKTMADLVTFLEKHGWEIISASQVSAAITTATSAWLTVLGTTHPSFYVMPVGIFDLTREQLIETYKLTSQ